MDQLNRRSFVKAAVAAAAGLAVPAAAFASEGKDAKAASAPAALPTYDTATNFNVVAESTTKVGTTLENLKTAITGETGATTKYAAFAKVAEEAGYSQIARLFTCTSDAEKIHIELEYGLITAEEPDFERPTADAPAEAPTDLNLISGANGEIYETSDMYPAFIAKAVEEGKDDAVNVFTRAKLAEGYHAALYLQAYNYIDNPDEDKFYLCPICGYIHKGEDFETCPICGAPKSAFQAY